MNRRLGRITFHYSFSTFQHKLVTMFESLRLRSVKRRLVLLFICHETSGFALLPTKLPNACQAILTRMRSKIPGSSPFESDGMLVYGQPTTPDGRVEVLSSYSCIPVCSVILGCVGIPISIVISGSTCVVALLGKKRKFSESTPAGWSILARGYI